MISLCGIHIQIRSTEYISYGYLYLVQVQKIRSGVGGVKHFPNVHTYPYMYVHRRFHRVLRPGGRRASGVGDLLNSLPAFLESIKEILSPYLLKFATLSILLNL